MIEGRALRDVFCLLALELSVSMNMAMLGYPVFAWIMLLCGVYDGVAMVLMLLKWRRERQVCRRLSLADDRRWAEAVRRKKAGVGNNERA